MVDDQAIMDAVALLVGGTVSPTKPHFYSGFNVGDATGVAGLKGCWSTVPSSGFGELPMAMVMAGPFIAKIGQPEEEVERFRLLVAVAPVDSESDMPSLIAYKKILQQLFRDHMQLGLAYGEVLQGFIVADTPGNYIIGGTEYYAWDFTLEVTREINYTYTS